MSRKIAPCWACGVAEQESAIAGRLQRPAVVRALRTSADCGREPPDQAGSLAVRWSACSMNAHELGLEVGKTYLARKGSRSPERTILWINESGTQVQYDGPAVANGRRYPTVSAEDFAKWAGLVPR